MVMRRSRLSTEFFNGIGRKLTLAEERKKMVRVRLWSICPGIAERSNTHKKARDCSQAFDFSWCRKWDSNPHAFKGGGF